MKEENEQNMQIVTFKLEQIASMQETTQQMEEKIEELSTELEKEKAERKEESKQHLEKIKDLTAKCKLLKAKNEKMKAAAGAAPAAAPAKEKPKKLSLFGRRGAAAATPKSESESEDSEEEALWIVCLPHFRVARNLGMGGTIDSAVFDCQSHACSTNSMLHRMYESFSNHRSKSNHHSIN